MARKYRKIISDQSDFEHVQYAVRISKSYGTNYGGLVCFDELAGSGGIYLEVFASKDTPEEQIQKALSIAFSERDIVSYVVRICPAEWLVEKE